MHLKSNKFSCAEWLIGDFDTDSRRIDVQQLAYEYALVQKRQ